MDTRRLLRPDDMIMHLATEPPLPRPPLGPDDDIWTMRAAPPAAPASTPRGLAALRRDADAGAAWVAELVSPRRGILGR